MNEADSVRTGQVSSEMRLAEVLPGWLFFIAAIWLLAPSGSTQFHAQVFDHEPKAQATRYTQLGIGSASWLSLRREGSGPSMGGMEGIQWRPRRLSFHPQAMTAVPLALLLLAFWARTATVVTALDRGQAWLKRNSAELEQGPDWLKQNLTMLKQRTEPFGRAASQALVIGLCATLLLMVTLPDAHEAVLQRADAEQLQGRLTEQLAAGKHRYSVKLARESGEQPQLVIRQYAWWLGSHDLFADLTSTTELQHADLRQFRIRRNPALLPLTVAIMLIAFAILVRRQRFSD